MDETLQSVLGEVLLETDQTAANWSGDTEAPTAEDYKADIVWRFARQLYGDSVNITKE